MKLLCALLTYFRGRRAVGLTGCKNHHLGLARLFEMIHQIESFGSVNAGGEQTMVAKDENFMNSKILDNTITLVKVARDPFMIVIPYTIVETQRSLIERE
jgi:hypothetical protein